jgi:hypothetical protein
MRARKHTRPPRVTPVSPRLAFRPAPLRSRVVPAPLAVTPLAARRFARAALHLDTPHPSLAAALAHHGFVQIDPINVCGRMHDLILRPRVAGYREGDLMRFLHGDAGTSAASAPAPLPASARTAFEHHAPDTGNLAAFGFEAWPHLQAAMRARSRRTSAWSGRLTPRERALAPALRREIAARGPLGAEDFSDTRRAHRRVWGAATLVKSTLQKLFFHGELLIAERHANRRRYALPDRVLPAAVLAQPAASTAETARWLVLLKLRQRRLATLKRTELPLVADLVQPLAVPGCPPLYCLRTDLPLLEAARAAESEPPPPAPVLLAPLDPLIYDRRVTAALWNFEYTWEVYTPPHKRVRGYYALPVLAGTELVGHVDPKADRPARRLRIVSRQVRRGHALAATVRAFARWLGLR